jgi:hypothetical protein
MRTKCFKLLTFTIWTFFAANALSQGLDIDCGRFKLEVSSISSMNFIYPADFNEEDHSNTSGKISFMSRNWTDRNKIYYETAYEQDLFALSSHKYLKYAPSQISVDGVNVSQSLNTITTVDNSIISDQIVEQTLVSSMGLKIISRTYGFSHPKYQDFAITHYMIINTGEADEYSGVDLPNQRINNLYFLMQRWNSWPDQHLSDRYHAGTNSFYIDYYGDEPADSLKIFYGWDGDDPDNGPYEDEGNPAYGADYEFLTPYYSGVGLIHADRSVSDRTNDNNKVTAVLRGSNYSLTNWSNTELFTYLTTPGNYPNPINPDLPGMNPKTEQQPRIYMSIGPYNLNFGDTVNVVMFYGVGARGTEECREWGLKYKNGVITAKQKNEFLRWGKTDLFDKLSSARRIWKNKLQLPEGNNLNPPSSIDVQSGPGYVELNWNTVPGAQSYKLYRAVGVKDSVLYPLLTQILTGTYYKDEDVNRGFDYYYNITAVDAKGVESSKYWARTSRKSAVPRTAQGVDDLSQVRVVPNPFVYDKSAKGNYPGQKDKLLFAGLPGPCKITIYTVSGDIVDEIDHDSMEGTQEWFQISKFNQYISSGVYIYHVESKEGRGSTIGKFIIVR